MKWSSYSWIPGVFPPSVSLSQWHWPSTLIAIVRGDCKEGHEASGATSSLFGFLVPSSRGKYRAANETMRTLHTCRQIPQYSTSAVRDFFKSPEQRVHLVVLNISPFLFSFSEIYFTMMTKKNIDVWSWCLCTGLIQRSSMQDFCVCPGKDSMFSSGDAIHMALINCFISRVSNPITLFSADFCSSQGWSKQKRQKWCMLGASPEHHVIFSDVTVAKP